MEKKFEDLFSELQADMVSICLEYVEGRAEVIYIYCSCEEKVIGSEFFYRINGVLVKRHLLNETTPPQNDGFVYDASDKRQVVVSRIINANIMEIEDLCKEHNRDMPTEFKLIYNVQTGSLEAKYRYDLVYSMHPDKRPYNVADEWFAEIQAL